MATLKDIAQAYEPPQTKNIADLEVVQTDIEILKKEYTRGEDGAKFSVNIMHINGEDYRVPNSVLKSLKSWLEEKPNLRFFKVKKSGEGLKTNYTLIPLDTVETPKSSNKAIKEETVPGSTNPN